MVAIDEGIFRRHGLEVEMTSIGINANIPAAILTPTLSERAPTLMEQDILAGHLAPGSRLGIVDLVQRYEIGATPLREGLSRLMSRGLIVGIGQRGFRVADICARRSTSSIPQATRADTMASAVNAWKPSPATPSRKSRSTR
jgi:DNA-binding GntR family transcriptional regulator